MTFSKQLKETMQQLHLTQRQISAMTGKSKASISQYLAGTQNPPEATKQHMAVSLGLPADHFTVKKKNVSTIDAIPRLDVTVAAQYLHMNHMTVRKGLQQGVFPWGYAIQTSENHWTYFINAKRFAEIERIDLPVGKDEKYGINATSEADIGCDC